MAEPPAGPVRVDVYPGHYAAAGKRFGDLGKLEHWVNQKGAKALVFHACMGSANARLTDAIERFRGAYVDVRWIDAGTHGCPTAAAAGRS